MRRSVAVSIILCVFFSLVIMAICCGLAHQILYWQKTPEKIYDMAYDYMFAVLLGTGATIFYNMISNILRALGDSRTPLVFLVFSSLLNIVLDVVFIVPFKNGSSRSCLGNGTQPAFISNIMYSDRREKISHTQTEERRFSKSWFCDKNSHEYGISDVCYVHRPACHAGSR